MEYKLIALDIDGTLLNTFQSNYRQCQRSNKKK